MSNQSIHSLVKIFFALWPTLIERGQLAAWQTPLKHLCGGRVMRAESLHATLVFLGEIEQDRLESLQLAAQEISAEGFDLCLDEARYWGHNHIVYAASSQVPPQLTRLVGALEKSLVEHRFKFDMRAYQPHVTLLRNAHWSDTLLPIMPAACWRVNDFALVQSTSQEYRVLVRFPLRPSDR